MSVGIVVDRYFPVSFVAWLFIAGAGAVTWLVAVRSKEALALGGL